MSINVTVSGNPINIRRGRVVLSDLDQIKKNERDRRRRLRLEQVRQQSKEISNRLLERAKNIAQQELEKLEKDDRSELKRIHERKIMEIQEKYQEDMENIGQAHLAAVLESEALADMEDKTDRNRKAALKRGKEASELLKKTAKDDQHTMHRQRLQQVRELENKRSSMVAELSKKSVCQDDTCRNFSQKTGMSCQQDQIDENLNKSTKKKKLKRLASNKSPVKKTRVNGKINEESQETHLELSPRQKMRVQNEVSKKCVTTDKSDQNLESINNTTRTDHTTQDEKSPRQMVPILTISTKAQKLARYNPGDYVQDSSDSLSSDSPSVSNDSSYFSDACDQSTCIRTPKHHTSLRDSKVQLYDHTTRQRNNYSRPLDVVERLDIRNEPNAVDAAREVERTESIESHVTETHKLASQKRGDDAILREKVRSDYKTLMKSLDHLSSEERKLKASDIQRDPMNDVQLRKSRRKELQKEHKQKLYRKFKAMTDKSCCASHCPNLVERIITLEAGKQSGNNNKKAEGTWKEAHFDESRVGTAVKSPKSKDKKQEITRDEFILDMLKKVERQKILLLKEFGASLPDDIYYASMTSLTEPDKSGETQKKMHQETCLSPEITLINMSNGEDNNGEKEKKVIKTSEPTKCEMAVQTSILQDAGIVEDKGIQVEIKTTSSTKALSVDEELPTKHYPIEPIITVITPEVEDSSSGSNNSITGVIIDIGNKEVKVTPKKKKHALKLSKRTSTKAMQKSHSAPPSKTSSPVKRFSKSLPTSCRSSPRKIDIHFKKKGFNVDVDPPDDTRPTIDSSTDSSAIYSSLNTQDSSIQGPYEIPVIKSKKVIKVRDSSDTSTSFASPPTLAPKRRTGVASTTTPILEMLDSSTFSVLERAKRDISPVSTPETPSPRTMMIPSNIPHPEKIGKMLRYGEGVNDITTSSNNKDMQSPAYERQEKDMSSEQSIYPQYSPTSPKSCTCQNPQCKLLHVKLENIQDFALKNCPEILKKYEDLQNTCTERIASLTDLIEKVRSEQRGMELSVISPRDEMSSMKIHPEMQSSMKNVQRLVENIEAIHHQLAKTLYESQNAIIKGEAINKNLFKDTENQLAHFPTKSKLDQSVSTTVERISDKLTSSKAKSKPRIIKEEKVNIKIKRFQMPYKSSATMTTATPERNSSSPNKIPTQNDNTIEELSKEILEQSTSKSTGMPAFRKIADYKNTDISLSTKSNSSKLGSPSKNEENNVPAPTTEITSTTESEKDVVAFEPQLVGIPKVLPSSTNEHRMNGKNKPPVTLHSGFYKTEIESMGHELSTIIEYDTPDIGNKSHVAMKSSTAKSFAMDESYREKSAVKKSVEVQTTKSSVTVKPSVHVAPLSIQNPLGRQISSSSTRKSTGEMLASKLQDEQTNLSRRTKNEMHSEYRMKDNAIRFEDSIKEKVNKQLQCNTSDKETEEMLQERFNGNENEKVKASSTSLNSFCELSGISEITSTPSSSLLKYPSSEEMETALKQLGLSWAITTLKKTREASALSSSSNSDITPLNTARRIISPNKKHVDSKIGNLLDFSDVSSISIKEASKSTEQAVLFKGRTSTPKLQNSNTNTDKSNSLATNSSGISFQEPSDSLTIPNISLVKTKQPNVRQYQYP